MKIEQGEKGFAVGVNKGDIHIHYGNKKIPAYLTTPPLNTNIFEGREKALQEVHDKLFGGSGLPILIKGQGGMGKTTFAAKYWLKYEREYTHLGVLYVGNGIADELLRLAPALQISFPNEMPDEQRLEVLFTHITALNKPCLLILDNADDAEDLGKYVVALSRCLNFHILLTSRLEKFTNTDTYPLSALDEKTALKVFKQNYDYYEPADETLFYEIFEAVGGNTLVMELLAKNLNNFNRNRLNYSLQALHEDLKKSLLDLSKSQEVDTAYQAKGTGLRHEKPEVIILAMYDLSELSEAEIALLSAFAVLPPESIAFASLETLLNSETFEDSLEKLTKEGWIEFEKNTKSYRVSPVVQGITRYKNQERLFGDCEKMIDVLCNKLDPTEENYRKENYQSATLYSHYAQSVTKYIANIHLKVTILFNHIGRLEEIMGNLSKALEFFEKYREISEQLSGLEPSNVEFSRELAASYSNLGRIYHIQGNLKKALEFYKKDLEICESLSLIEPSNVDFSRGLGGGVLQIRGYLLCPRGLEPSLSVL
ncbi:MAG: tetratricopeptide repeat protein [Cytophagales bacterium]|nr:MAG: tetratricopeptide repeat protein [Cytophagales bacterium]TAF59956.1 MAG: tetratricopeptide repeat protein [Cytophagales bacterium]